MAATEIAKKIRARISDPRTRIGSQVIQINASSGVTHVGDIKGETTDEIISLADKALYRAKARGRDQVKVALPADLESLCLNHRQYELIPGHSAFHRSRFVVCILILQS